MMTACNDPELITEITLQPVRRYGVDAAIFFSDIVVPVRAVGIDLDIVPGVGPVVAEPIRDAAGVGALRGLTPDDVAGPLAAVRLLVDELGSTPLIGFAGAPFTLASYLIEGGPSRDHAATKSLMLASRSCGTWPTGWPWRGRTSRCRSRPGPPRCSCSIPGPARCRAGLP